MRSAPAAAICIALLAIGAVSGVAQAQTLERARELYLGADFEAALSAFDEVLARPDLSPFDALAAHLHLAALHLVLGAPDEARAHAEAAIAIDPSAEPPAGAPPPLAAMLARARSQLDAPARFELVRRAGDPRLVVEARLVPAPRLLAARLRLRCATAVDPPVSRESAPPEVVLRYEPAPSASSVRCRADALTAGGASLVLGSEVFALAEKDRAAERPIWPWVAGAAGIVATSVIVAVLLATRGADEARVTGARVEPW